MNKAQLATLAVALALWGQLAATSAQAGAFAAADRLGALRIADMSTEAGLLHRISSDDDDDEEDDDDDGYRTPCRGGDDDDDDDDEGSACRSGGVIPAVPVAPPANGLFGTGAPPKAQVN
ncbi:hypothetical protein SAMN04488103_104194 [Gemmobacter aquatilis]|uniref:Uncharacterized protein n=1 Tax=Gemmobacter aquatilis TaxID=933059 RepID=A0A1H8FLH7_9RHOB|nr:hypothetical protein [Gemmobacter aquatilis]SEN32460.1 hypothetical protein SAMN04488103_104194 [Gemmobacter aquatilis]